MIRRVVAVIALIAAATVAHRTAADRDRWRNRANAYRAEINAAEGRTIRTGRITTPIGPNDWLFDAYATDIHDAELDVVLGSHSTLYNSLVHGVEINSHGQDCRVERVVIWGGDFDQALASHLDDEDEGSET